MCLLCSWFNSGFGMLFSLHASIYITCISTTLSSSSCATRDKNEKEEGAGRGLFSCWCNSGGQLALSSFSVILTCLFWNSKHRRARATVVWKLDLQTFVCLQSNTSSNHIKLVRVLFFFLCNVEFITFFFKNRNSCSVRSSVSDFRAPHPNKEENEDAVEVWKRSVVFSIC